MTETKLTQHSLKTRGLKGREAEWGRQPESKQASSTAILCPRVLISWGSVYILVLFQA
jgi:hypothetical protein